MLFKTPISVADLAAKLGGTVHGHGEVMLSGINEIHRVQPGDVTFSDHPKYIQKAMHSAAWCVLVNSLPADSLGKSLILLDKPFDTFTALCKELATVQTQAGPVAETAEIGEGTVIRPGVFIGHQVKIGKHCLIHPNVTIYDNTIIGDRVVIHAGTVIGSDAFYFKKQNGYQKLNSCGRVVIGNDVEIGASCSIDRGVTSDTVIGDGTKMDNQVHVGHDTVIGKNCLFAAQVGIAGVVTIEDDVILWGQVGVQKDLTIGKGAVVLGQSGIASSLEGGVTYFGSPVREARAKMKEIAFVKQLPDIIREIKAHL